MAGNSALNAPRSTRIDVDGWVVLDKRIGLTSTQAVGRLKRLFNARKAGHAGTLDPLASGVLPVAFGEATKTVPFVQDSEKTYHFTVRWGAETDTDDADGVVLSESHRRPDAATITASLPSFLGTVVQVPPTFSAIKINGERAYALARGGETPAMQPREVNIRTLRLVDADQDWAEFAAECGKGTYVRAIARDLGRMLGCLGHVTALRRTCVGPFDEGVAVTLDELTDASVPAGRYLRPVEAGLSGLACVSVDRTAAARLRRGQSILLRGPDTPLEGEAAYAACGGVVIAVGAVESGELVPHRVFNLPF